MFSRRDAEAQRVFTAKNAENAKKTATSFIDEAKDLEFDLCDLCVLCG
jgi:hypothetical protein